MRERKRECTRRAYVWINVLATPLHTLAPTHISVDSLVLLVLTERAVDAVQKRKFQVRGGR